MFSVLTRVNLLIIVVVGLFFAAYSWGFEFTPTLYPARYSSPVSTAHVAIRPGLKNTLMTQFRQWEGVKYRFGGVNRNGIDCSAFVREVMASVDISLPRTTHYQITRGIQVRREALQPGDLVFFKPTPKTRHVGIYLGQGQFMHASTRKGVTISRLDNGYWGPRYDMARRIVAGNMPS